MTVSATKFHFKERILPSALKGCLFLHSDGRQRIIPVKKNVLLSVSNKLNLVAVSRNYPPPLLSFIRVYSLLYQTNYSGIQCTYTYNLSHALISQAQSAFIDNLDTTGIETPQLLKWSKSRLGKCLWKFLFWRLRFLFCFSKGQFKIVLKFNQVHSVSQNIPRH